MSDNLRNFQTALFGFDGVVRRVADDQWDLQSPCAEWKARDIVTHCIGMNTMIAGFTKGIDAAAPDEQPVTDPSGEWRASLDSFMAALDGQGALQAVAKTPWGELAVDRFLGIVWVDPLIHTWDLSRAVGQPAVLDEAQAVRAVKQLTKAGKALVAPGRFDEPNETSSDDPIAQLAAISGRDPGFGS